MSRLCVQPHRRLDSGPSEDVGEIGKTYPPHMHGLLARPIESMLWWTRLATRGAADANPPRSGTAPTAWGRAGARVRHRQSEFGPSEGKCRFQKSISMTRPIKMRCRLTDFLLGMSPELFCCRLSVLVESCPASGSVLQFDATTPCVVNKSILLDCATVQGILFYKGLTRGLGACFALI
jgi:hypothetical protein